MRPKFRLEEVTSISGEVEYRIWKMKWFGLKKAKIIAEYKYLDSAQMHIESLRNAIIVKKKYID
jgi:hypothetical protein